MGVRNYLVDAFYSLSANVNKRSAGEERENAEGVIGPKVPELTLDMDESEMVTTFDQWEKTWNESPVKSKWETRGDENERYWKGEHYERPEVDKTRPTMDNAIFEGLETYLPQVTRRNPEAMVSLAVGVEKSQANEDFAHALQLELGELADELKIRLKLKGVARHWSIRLLGAVKLGWNIEDDLPAVKVLRPTKLILDPAATVDEDGYTGERIGEHRKLTASAIIAVVEKFGGEDKELKIKAIKELAKENLATEIGFIEWWTPKYTAWKLNSMILFKRKNPHWNYDEVLPTTQMADEGAAPEGADRPVPEAGEKAPVEAATADQGSIADDIEAENTPPQGPAVPQLPEAAPVDQGPRKGVNHFRSLKMPYILLSIYNLGKQPVDETSNIGQNLANQDLINKRIRQIDNNADDMNNGMVVSLERSGLTKDQAKGVTTALRKRGVVAIPAGAPTDAIWKPPTPGLPADVYNQLVDTRNRVRDIWGTSGSTPAGVKSEKTVRGKLIVQGMDTDRIGGGISEFLEQFSDDLYNWIVQLLYVHDDRFQTAIANGTPLPQIKVSVKEGSLLPKDSTTIANQAMELAGGGKMSTVDLYKRLDYPNPEELAANAWLEVNAPEILYSKDPRVAQVMKQRAAAAGQSEKKAPSQSINFKDLPPEGRAQMAAEVGIQLDPEGIAAHDAFKNAGESSPAKDEGMPALGP